MKIVFYSPDRHLVYAGDTPERVGVGGGVTARILLARALARRGHDVRLVGNVEREHHHDGVQFLPLDEVDRVRSDVLVVNSSGGELDVGPVLDVERDVGLVEVWVQGYIPIGNVDALGPRYIVAPSNYIRNVAQNDWGVPEDELFVIYNGFPRFGGLEERARDPFRLVYSSHPSKGLETAVEILRLLRERDTRYELHVYGGDRLWGGEERDLSRDGVDYHGLVGQRELAQDLHGAGFSMNLQERPEPFGIVVTESMAAGLIVVASSVGAFPELVEHGRNGLLIDGDHTDPAVRERAAEAIHRCATAPGYSAHLRREALSVPWDWDLLARVWVGHWRWELERQGTTSGSLLPRCGHCDGEWLLLADGSHCMGCGRYRYRDAR